MPDRRPGATRGRRYNPASIVGVYVLVLVVLQIFLLSVALDAFHSYDAGLAWGAAAVSVVLAAGVLVFARLLGRR